MSAYQNPVVKQAVEDRIAYFRNKASELYSLQIYYVILYEGAKHRTKLSGSLMRLASEPTRGVGGTEGIPEQQEANGSDRRGD